MSRVAALCALISVLPTFAAADALERYETAVETGNRNVNDFLLSRVPALAGKMPPAEWEEPDREIGRCVLDKIRAAAGEAGVDTHLQYFETVAATRFTTYAEFIALMTTPISGPGLSAGLECGQQDRAALLAVQSGMMEVLADPANQQLLMAD